MTIISSFQTYQVHCSNVGEEANSSITEIYEDTDADDDSDSQSYHTANEYVRN